MLRGTVGSQARLSATVSPSYDTHGEGMTTRRSQVCPHLCGRRGLQGRGKFLQRVSERVQSEKETPLPGISASLYRYQSRDRN